MKIIHIEEYFNPTAGYQINELLKADKKSEKVLITSTNLEPLHKVYDEQVKEDDRIFSAKYNVKIIRLDVRFKVGTRLLLKGTKKVIKEENPDVLFMHGIGDFKDLYYILRKPKFKIFRDCHMSWVASKNKFANLYYKFFALLIAPFINKLNMYDKIFALGVEEKEYLYALGIKEKKIASLVHGYREEEFFVDKELREKYRKILKIEKKETLISYIGKFDGNKRPEILFDIFNKFSEEEMENIKILFLGPQQKDYMKEVFNKKLELFKYKDRLIFEEGKKASELVKYYNATDICLWPKETTLSSIHAQISGCNVIMEDETSNKERVVANENLYPKDDLEKAKEIVLRLKKEGKQNFSVKELEKREYKNIIRELEKY